MTALIDRLFDSYDRGRLSRRGLVRTLVPLFAAVPASAADTLTVKSLNHVTLFVSDVERSREDLIRAVDRA